MTESPVRRVSKRSRSISHTDATTHNIEPMASASTTRDNNHLMNALVTAICQHQIEQVRQLIQLYPQLVRVRDARDCLAVHWACHQGAPVAILESLVSAWPDALRERDQRGCLPLHLVCGRGSSVERVKLLVSKYAQAVHESSGEGCLPIHYACRDNAPLGVIKYLANQSPGTLLKKTFGTCIHSGFLPFHFLCVGSSFDSVKWMMKQEPKVVEEVNCDGSLPLHLLCRNPRATVELITFLLEQYPIALSQENREGMTPGDIAIKVNNIEIANVLDDIRSARNSTKSVIQALAEFPLHRACSNPNVTIEEVKCILKESLDESCVPDGEGCLPIHVACRARASFEVIKLLTNDYPESLEWTNKGGSLPLHTACSNRASVKIVEYLVEACPDAAEVPNNFGWLPLHCACAYGASLDVVRVLVQQYPVGVKMKTYTHGDDPLHLASSGKTSLDVVKWLVEACKGENPKKNSSGETALDRAVFNHAPNDVIHFLSLL